MGVALQQLSLLRTFGMRVNFCDVVPDVLICSENFIELLFCQKIDEQGIALSKFVFVLGKP